MTYFSLQGEVPNIVDVPDPDHMSARERHEARLLCEDSSFSADHYLLVLDMSHIFALLWIKCATFLELT